MCPESNAKHPSFTVLSQCCTLVMLEKHWRNIVIILPGNFVWCVLHKPPYFKPLRRKDNKRRFFVSTSCVLTHGLTSKTLLCVALVALFSSACNSSICDSISINLSLLTTAVKDKKMQENLTLVVSLNIGENKIPNPEWISNFFSVIKSLLWMSSFLSNPLNRCIRLLHDW